MYYEWLDSYLKRELQGIKELYVKIIIKKISI